MNFVPVTTCTDLLRPGGYARLTRYLENLGAKMNEMGVTRIPDFVVRYTGQGAAAIDQVMREMCDSLSGAGSGVMDKAHTWLQTEVYSLLKAWLRTPATPLESVCEQIAHTFEQQVADEIPPATAAALRTAITGMQQALVDVAGLLNTPRLVEETTANPRYSWERNKSVPRKIGSKLWLYDCINCDKCVPVCPNDANFVYETSAAEIPYNNFELTPGESPRPVPGGVFKVAKAHQLANYADACNDCGNCDVFCPEDGGPYIEKPRFFGSLETYRKYAGRNGFYLAFEHNRTTIYGTIAGTSYTLSVSLPAGRAWFDDGLAEIEIRLSDDEVVSWKPKPETAATRRIFNMLPYLQLKLLVAAIRDSRHVHFANTGALSDISEKKVLEP
jgi:putative selenate reductase